MKSSFFFLEDIFIPAKITIFIIKKQKTMKIFYARKKGIVLLHSIQYQLVKELTMVSLVNLVFGILISYSDRHPHE